MRDRESPLALTGDRQFIRRLLIIALVVIVSLVIWQILDIILLAFGSVIFAVLLHGVADPLARSGRISAEWALTATVLLLLLIFGLIGWIFGSEVSTQVSELGSIVPEAWRATEERLRESPLGRPFLEWLNLMLGRSVSGAGYYVMSVGTAIAGFFAILIGGIYLAFQPRLYRTGLLKLFPKPLRPAVEETLDASGGALRLWLVGQLVAMLLVGVLTGIGAWLIGLPSAIALGLLAGMLEFIPYAGPLLTAVPALLIAATMGTQTVIATLFLLAAVQQVEGYLITPIVQRKAVSLPPALTLFALIAMGLVFGPLGVLLAAPLTVVIYVAVKELYIRRILGEDTVVPGEPSSH